MLPHYRLSGICFESKKMETMREKNRTCVFNTSPKLKHLPVPLGVSAVPIVDVLYNRVFVTSPTAWDYPEIREAGIRDHDIGSKARAWWKN